MLLAAAKNLKRTRKYMKQNTRDREEKIEMELPSELKIKLELETATEKVIEAKKIMLH